MNFSACCLHNLQIFKRLCTALAQGVLYGVCCLALVMAMAMAQGVLYGVCCLALAMALTMALARRVLNDVFYLANVLILEKGINHFRLNILSVCIMRYMRKFIHTVFRTMSMETSQD